MLDTIILTIPRGSYKLKREAFTPNAGILLQAGNYLIKCVNNPTATDKKEGLYKPRMTLMKRMTRKGDEIPLKIEFSVAKMIYGNNVDEVEEKDFERVIDNLHEAMKEMGVLVQHEDLRNAKVSAFHPSKNVELTNGYTSSFVITELHKIDVSKKMDLNRDSFRNSGHSLQFYTNSHSLVVYDKVQDLKKPDKRAMDEDQNSLQLSLFDTLNKEEKKEILRIEVRLAKKVKMNAILKSLKMKENPTFKDVFKKEVCQKILLNYWNELIAGKNLFLFDAESNPKKTLDAIFKSKPKIKPKDALYLVGLRVLSKEGIRDTRAVIERYATSRTWYRIAEDLKFLDGISRKTYHGWLKEIGSSIEKFEPYKTSVK
ncbi:MAG: hypothetical protein O3A36_03225 [bacterium]|nr:hypothetical protein [bacterium]